MTDAVKFAITYFVNKVSDLLKVLSRHRNDIVLIGAVHCRKCEIVEDMLWECDFDRMAVVNIDYTDMEEGLRDFLRERNVRIPAVIVKDTWLYVNPFRVDNICELIRSIKA